VTTHTGPESRGATMATTHALPAGLVSPSTVTVYGARPDLRDVLYTAVSQSVSSPDPLHLAVARGLDPDKPRGLHEVTETL
jgi:fructoselysine-6-P-deglycase FrlB-like protein